MLSDADLRLLQGFLRARDRSDRPVAVGRLADELGVSQPAVSRRLQDLRTKGWIGSGTTNTGSGRMVHYEPLPGVALQWVSPERGIATDWESHGEIDWRYPLVSQIPDEDARGSIVKFLHMVAQEGLLAGSGDGRSDRGPVVIVYGSTVRADARPDADLDLVLLVDHRWTVSPRRKLDRIAADASLVTPRPLHQMVLKMPEFEALPDALREDLAREGRIVYDGWGADHDLWPRLYSSRSERR